MDFSFSPEADEAAALAAGLFASRCTSERLRQVEQPSEDGLRDRFDPDLWRAVAEAGLLGLNAPVDVDGAGLGLLEAIRVVVEAGRTTAPVPMAAHSAAVSFLARHATPEQCRLWLGPAVRGELIVVPAISEVFDPAPELPATGGAPYTLGMRVVGTKEVVPAATRADLFLVSVATEEGLGVYAVKPDDHGVRIESQQLSDGSRVGRLLLDAPLTPDRLIGALDGVAEADLRHLATVFVCAEQLGVTEGALALTAGYARTREQFGRAIGTFQAVAHRLADGHIDLLGQRLTLWQAAWRLDSSLPAQTEVAVAKLWAADAGHRLAHTTVHVHGGVGIDLDGEAHRYFTAAKRLEFTLGGAAAQAQAIGRHLADS